jgi:pimeloyl-ACP methyl ester carboxylesterase
MLSMLHLLAQLLDMSHSCLGAALARAEIQIAINTTLRRTPKLQLAAEQTHHIHQLVNDELARVMVSAQRVAIPKATHEMWSQQPEAYGRAVSQFLRAQGAA